MEQARPLLSVIVPTRDRPAALARCLASLAELDYPRDRYEVLVVDDGGAASLDPALAGVSERVAVRVVRQDHAGPGAARNIGARHARGRWLAFTDDDCEVAGDWLRRLEQRTREAPDAMIGGRTVNLYPENLFSSASHLLVEYLYEYYMREGRLGFFTSNNLSVPADRFRRIGGYYQGWSFAAGEDRELCDRWRHRGGELVYAPEVVVRHGHLLDFRRFCRQHFNYGRGAFHFHRARALDGRGRREMEPARFYTGMLAHPFRGAPLHKPVSLAALLVLSQAMNAAGFFRERGRAPAAQVGARGSAR